MRPVPSDLPPGWDVLQLRYVAGLQSGSAITSDDIEAEGAIPVFGGNGLRGYTDRWTHTDDHVLIGRQGALCGNVNVAHGPFWASEHAIVVTPSLYAPSSWLASVLWWLNLGDYSLTAAQPGISVDVIGHVKMPVPPPDERRAIAEFLDRETAQIDAMIDAQQRLVSLLSERRLSTISEFVRSGVDGAVPTTTTGLPWLPQVPVTWRVVPAKAVFAQRTETSRPDDTHLTPSQQYGVMPQHEYMELTGNKVVLNLTGADNMRHVEPDDFVIHLRSFQGGIEHSKYRGKVSMAYTVLTPRPGAVPDYFRWVLKSSTYVQALQTTTNQLRDGQSIKYAEFATIPLPFPPEEQQRGIAAHLSGEIAQIDRMRQKVEHSIALLRERRAAVITAAVTGRLDPRTGVERVEEMLEGAAL